MAKTAAPSGLTLTRSNNWFAAKWKIAAKNYGDGQGAQYRLGNGKWQKLSIGKTTTTKSFSVTMADWYPYAGKKTLPSVSFRVQGNQSSYRSGRKTINPSVSNWSTKTFTFKAPRVPSVEVEIGTWPQVSFKWTVSTDKADVYWFTDAEYQSVLVQDSNITDGAQIDWDSAVGQRYTGTGGTSNTVTITEDSGQLNDGHSYTRWLRVRSRGVAGASAWRYAKHVYALPNQPVITNWEVTNNAEANGYTCKVWFNSPFDASRPIAQVETQYALAVPDAGMVCPDGASWQTGSTALAKDGTGGAVFSIDSLLSANQCLFVRVNATYDGKTTYGSPVMVDSGVLSDPSGLSVQTNASQYTATVTATNNSAVADSFLVVRYYSADEPNGFDIGIIPHGQTSVIVQCPQWTSTDAIVFGVYAVVGEYEATVREDGVSSYAVTPVMQSANVVKSGGSVPVAPANVSASQTKIPGTIRVVWDWSWGEADSAEISWADHDDAWESTDEPSTYKITRMHASAWNISGLDTGKKWYVRVRLISSAGDAETYGAYSDTVELDLSSAPTVPVMALSDAVITEGGTVTATWAYSTTDGTPQAFAEVAEVTTSGGQAVYTPIAQTETAQYVTLDAEELGWSSGEIHRIAVRVVSGSGRMSDGWSDSVAVLIANPLTCTIASTSLQQVTMESTDEDDQPVSYTVTALTEMPLTATITGAGDSGTTTLIIERAAAYHVDRPDETDYNGFEGETIAILSQVGEAPFTVELTDLIGHLDDSAEYRLIATVQDGLGQSAQASIDFTVVWNHQAIVPNATVLIDQEYLVAVVTPIAPEGVVLASDTCDIYRLSVDKPELIYVGAEFGTPYVDPFPTIGEYGGHRFVFRTENGDYITADEQFAWLDTGEDENDILETPYNIIEFGTGRALIEYNVDVSNSWTKDFKETQYLGGSVQGDWNPAVSRTGSVNTVAVRTQDQDLIETMRRLAVWPGICHVRTKEGSSYPADVQVSETVSISKGHKISDFSLKITRVDQEALDGLTFAEWQETQQEEE